MRKRERGREMKRKVYHWYPENSEKTTGGYHKTACGRDGRKVGGLITPFFEMDTDPYHRAKKENRCKICEKKFRRLKR